MKVHRYSEHQRRLWVHQMVHKTKSIKAICAEAQISRATLYNWLNELNETDEKAKEEQSKTASLAWQPTDKYKMLLSALVKTDADKSVSRKLVRELIKRYNLTVAQACALADMPEETYNHRPRKPEADDKEVYAALVHVLGEDKSRNLEDCIAVLQISQPQWAIRQIRRIYRQGRLYLKRTRIRRVPSLSNKERDNIAVETPFRLLRKNAFWHIGLIEQPTGNEEKNWLLYLLDYNDGTPLNTLTGTGETTETDVMQLVTKAAEENGLPKKIRIPAGAPFASRGLSKWSWGNKVALHNLSMAKPENALEAGYIKEDIKKQLDIDERITPEALQKRGEHWIQSFAQQGKEAVNYFVKEAVID